MESGISRKTTVQGPRRTTQAGKRQVLLGQTLSVDQFLEQLEE